MIVYMCMYVHIYIYIYIYIHTHLYIIFIRITLVFLPFVCGSTHDVRCFSVQDRILPDRKSKWADERLKGHSPFRSEARDNIVIILA